MQQIGEYLETTKVAPPVTIGPSDEPHYVLQTEPSRELTVQANLMMRGLPFYLPTIFRAARLSAKRQAMGAERPDVALPLFPRTFFVAESVIQRRYHDFRALPGLISQPFMKFGQYFAMLRPLEMQVVRAIEAKEREVYFRRKRRLGIPDYVPNVGDQVRILLDELLGGMTCTVAEVDEKGRITILAEIMKRAVRVKVTANQIEPV